MRLPDFVIIGAMKSGTTSLYHSLGELAEFSLSDMKEPHFFCDERKWAKGVNWYASLFAQSQPERLTGEASTSYADPRWANTVANRMAMIVPQAKLIYVLRHPEERLRSHYRHEVQRGRERRPFVEAVLDPSNPYVGRSLYHTCLVPFTEVFSRDQILVLRFEDLVGVESRAWFKILEHLDVPKRPRPDTPYLSTWKKPQYTRLMLFLFEHGLTNHAKKVPKGLRSVARKVLLTTGKSYETQLRQSSAPLPQQVTTRIWEDIQRLEDWLGLDEYRSSAEHLWPLKH